jgi:hypothetical protein
VSSPDQKRYATLAAQAALHGIALHRLQGDFAPVIYIASEGPYTRQLDDLDQVAAFLQRRLGKAVEVAA